MRASSKLLVAGAALVFGTLAPATATVASAGTFGQAVRSNHTADNGGNGSDKTVAVVSVESGPYGKVLVVGGAGAGYVPATPTTPARYNYPAGSSLYFPTIDPSTTDLGDHAYHPGCTTVVDPTAGFACTGSPVANSSDWPALTTSERPVAGPGVSEHLLGEVYRADLGTMQVTYAGHPLYLFDPGPNSFFGANFFESVAPLPPWHTAWYLINPNGLPAPGAANLESEAPTSQTTYTSPAVAAEMLPAVIPGGAAISVYSFSLDSWGNSACSGACARDFIPLYTDGRPTAQSGINAERIGVIERSDGSHQVSYNGHPLYLYSQEQPAVNGSGKPITTGSVGNGNGTHAFDGTFKLVTP